MSEERNDLFYFAEQTSPDSDAVKNFEFKKHSEGDIWWLRFPACLHQFEVLGRNGRQYIGDNIMSNVFSPRNKSYMDHNGWFGEMDHPWAHKENEALSRKRIASIYMPNRSHKIINPVRRGNELWADIETCPSTDAGKGMGIEIVQGYIPCFSCRSTGLMKVIKGKPTVLTNFIATYDWVLYPGFGGAEMKGTPTVKGKSVSFTESGESQDLMIPLSELYNDLAESDPSLNAYMESYDIDISNIVGISDDKKDIVINPDNGLYIFAGMNKKSISMINDFYRSNF